MKNAFYALTLLLAFVGSAFGQTATANFDGTQNVSSGNSLATNAGNAQSITFQGGQGQATLPGTLGAPSFPNPGIFGPLGNTPGSASVPFTAAANRLCNVRYVRSARPKTELVEHTDSGQTRIIFSAYPSLLAEAKSKVELEEVVPPDLSPSVVPKAVCLGTLTVITKESSGNKTDFSVVQNDAMQYLFGTVRGFKKVAFISLLSSVSAASGVSIDANSFGIGGVLGKTLSAVASLGLAPTFGVGSGNTTPSNFPGGTFLVVALEEETGQTLDMSELGRFFLPQQTASGKLPPAVKNEGSK